MLLLSPADLTFAARWVGFGTDTQGISVSNVGDAPLQIQSVVLSAPGFALDQHDCGGTLAPGAGCSLLASFKPSTTGSQSAVITVTDDTLGSPHIITLHGVGLDLILTLSRPSRPRRSSAEVVIAGATARFDLSVLSNATAGRVVFNCEGTPASSMCQVEPPVLDLGPGPSQVAVSFTTSTHQKAAVDGTGVEWQGTPLGLHVLHITATAGPVSRVIDIPVEVQQGDGLSSTQQGSEPGRNDRTDAVRPPEAVPHGSSISGQHVVIPERSESPLKTSRSEIVFGAVRIGNAASEEIEITNQAIGSLQLECRATGDFEVISDCGQVLEPGKTYSVKTRFTPARTGKRAGKLTVSSGDTVLTISLQGEGLSTQQ